MALRLNGSTSGYAALDAPAVAGNNTLKLPTGNGSTGQAIKGDGSGNLSWSTYTEDGSGNFAFNSGYGSAAVAYGCRAWVNFNGTTASPSTIRGSGNVSSVTKNGTGDYTVNFTNALPDANYTACFGSRGASISTGNYTATFENRDSVGRTTSTLRLYTLYTVTGTSGAVDAEVVSVAIFR